ncbi:lysoplasmalogenase family protein [Nostocoides australiense]
MPRAASALKLAYGALAVADTALAGSRSTRAHRIRLVTKPLLMPVLTGAFAADPRSARSPLRDTTRAGQALGWLGDVALLRPGLPAFAAGVGAFGLGQAAYIRGFRANASPVPLRHNTAGRAAAVMFALSGAPMAIAAARHERVLGPAVLGYAALLTAMAANAANLDPALPAGARAATAAGGAAFLVSDTILGASQFLLADPPPWVESAVMATYTAAQYLLAMGALRCGGSGS